MLFKYQMLEKHDYEVKFHAIISTMGLKFFVQIILESKNDDFGNCYIDFKIFESDGAMAVNEQSEKQKCQTYGLKNQLIFGPDWSAWEGWVQFRQILKKGFNSRGTEN